MWKIQPKSYGAFPLFPRIADMKLPQKAEYWPVNVDNVFNFHNHEGPSVDHPIAINSFGHVNSYRTWQNNDSMHQICSRLKTLWIARYVSAVMIWVQYTHITKWTYFVFIIGYYAIKNIMFLEVVADSESYVFISIQTSVCSSLFHNKARVIRSIIGFLCRLMCVTGLRC